MYLVPASTSVRSNKPPPFIPDGGARRQRIKAPTKIQKRQKRPALNKKRTAKRLIGTRMKHFKRFKKRWRNGWSFGKKNGRHREKTERRAIYDALNNVSLTPLETRTVSSALANPIATYLQTASPKPSEPCTPGDMSVETRRRTISVIEPEPSTSTGGILETPRRNIKGEYGGTGHAVQDFWVEASST
jgi:hypothetical protein